MKLASPLMQKGARQTAADAGREALRSAGRGARRGAKRGAGIGAAKGAGESVAKQTRSRLSGVGDSVKATTDRIADNARSVRDRTRARASRVAEAQRRRAQRHSRPSKQQTIVTATAAGAAGAAGAYFLDPNDGKRRRHVARDRTTALARRQAQSLRRRAEYRKGEAIGVVKRAGSKLSPEGPAPNDQDLADRVRSELFRPADAPKGSVNVNAENGVIYLRGKAATAEQREELGQIVAKIDGVRGVKNLLHLPGEAAKAES